ncbi:MAG: hypothetical protein JWO28_2275 [Hyphomicrobiales bacterium]|jgi:uncharacterized membrane protein|nr:hypothetical protein [Hyphomicrobiales bacterium]
MTDNNVEASGITPRTWAIIIWGLLLVSCVTVWVTEIIGVIIAYVKRDELAGTLFESHATSAIRTFWVTLVFLPLGTVLLIAGIFGVNLLYGGLGILILGLLLIWRVFRVFRGLIRAFEGKGISNPTGVF